MIIATVCNTVAVIPEKQEPDLASDKALELKQLSKVFKGGVIAVDRINLGVEKGDFFALLGPNGAGKSTTLGMISSLINKTSGQIRIFGHDLGKKPARARKMLGMMPQEVNLNIFETPLQILLNQAGYFAVSRKKALPNAEKLLEDMALWDKRHIPVRFLSGGMKRRLMVARALVHQPGLLILDEPTAGVDVELRESLWRSMQKLNQEGLTIILTTHYLEEAENMCNKIALINQGRVEVDDEMQNLLRNVNLDSYRLDLRQKPQAEYYQFSFGVGRLIDPLAMSLEVHEPVTMNDIFTELSTHDIEVMNISTRKTRLERLFLNSARQKAQEA